MPTSEARIQANRENAQRSTGPKTPEGKERSRGNAYKHGLTGEGVVLPEADAAEVDRRAAAFEAELKPSGEVGRTLVRRIALLSVRMNRGEAQEFAAVDDRVRRAKAEFVAPEGLDEREGDRLRTEAGHRALFDPSKQATLARKYEAAAERGFFRALKELRQLERPAKPAPNVDAGQATREALGSLLQAEKQVAGLAVMTPKSGSIAPPRVPILAIPADLASLGSRFDVPITIGRPR